MSHSDFSISCSIIIDMSGNTVWPLSFSSSKFLLIDHFCCVFITGLRKSRYKGTNRGTKGTVVNQTLLLLPRFPYKNIIIARYLDFRIEKKKKENRGTNCVESKRAHSQPGTYVGHCKNRKYDRGSGET